MEVQLQERLELEHHKNTLAADLEKARDKANLETKLNSEFKLDNSLLFSNRSDSLAPGQPISWSVHYVDGENDMELRSRLFQAEETSKRLELQVRFVL